MCTFGSVIILLLRRMETLALNRAGSFPFFLLRFVRCLLGATFLMVVPLPITTSLLLTDSSFMYNGGSTTDDERE
jgi:hypothetical protein